MMKELNKRTRIMLGTILLTTIVVLIGIGYAYFSASPVSGNTDNTIEVITSTHGDVIVTYDDGNKIINMDNLDLGYDNRGINNYDYIKFKIDYTGTVDQDVYIYWQDVRNSFCQYADVTNQVCTNKETDTIVADEINYTTYECGNETSYNNASYNTEATKVISGCNIVNIEKTAMPKTLEKKYILTGDKVTLNNNTKYYMVVAEVKNKEERQNYNQGKIYNGMINVAIEPIGNVATFGSDILSYNNPNALGYKILTDANTTKFTTQPNFSKAAVSPAQYVEAPTSLADYKLKVCDSDSRLYDSYYCSVCTEGHANYNASSCNAYYTNNTTTYLTTAENGMFRETSEEGTTYYYRGYIENNYVSFAGFTWRIMRINEDGSIRMILDGLLNTVKKNGSEAFAGTKSIYNSLVDTGDGPSDLAEEATAIEYATYYNSTLETAINNFYIVYIDNSNDIDYSNHLTDSNYCSDATWGIKGSLWAFAPRDRLFKEIATPTYNCPLNMRYSVANNKLTNPVATITANEVVYAGAKIYTSNTDYYLLNNTTVKGNYWWTMSPNYWGSNGNIRLFHVIQSGSLNNSDVSSSRGVRPVLNLKVDTIVINDGNGTSERPYLIAN